MKIIFNRETAQISSNLSSCCYYYNYFMQSCILLKTSGATVAPSLTKHVAKARGLKTEGAQVATRGTIEAPAALPIHHIVVKLNPK